MAAKRIAIYSVLLCVLYAVFAIAITSASSTVIIGIAWDHDEPETVDWYNIYISETQGVYPDKPYRRTTKLPTDASPFYLQFNVDTKTIYLKLKAENENGESDWSEEIKVEMSFIVTYLE